MGKLQHTSARAGVKTSLAGCFAEFEQKKNYYKTGQLLGMMHKNNAVLNQRCPWKYIIGHVVAKKETSSFYMSISNNKILHLTRIHNNSKLIYICQMSHFKLSIIFLAIDQFNSFTVWQLKAVY